MEAYPQYFRQKLYTFRHESLHIGVLKFLQLLYDEVRQIKAI